MKPEFEERRAAAYQYHVNKMKQFGAKPRTREEFDVSIEKHKERIASYLARRRCPMYWDAIGDAVANCGYSGKNVPRHSVAMEELVEDGVLIETHYPDGKDTWHHRDAVLQTGGAS